MSEPTTSLPLEETVVIVGVGLIGGSLASALKRRNAARQIIGIGRDATRIEAARDAGLIDEAATDIAQVIARANLIVFCTPVELVAAQVRIADAAWQQCLNRSTTALRPLLTDAGSVKETICHELSDVTHFIGSHPIAGSHRQGFQAADANLFEGRLCVLTPSASSPESQVQRLERFWQAVGMRTVRMSPTAHDQSLAMTSHLPHVVAAALASTLSDENRIFTGSGFRDTTRVAAGDPELWTGILFNNAENVLSGIDDMQKRLAAYRQALATRDAVELRKLLNEAYFSRQALAETSDAIDRKDRG